MASTGKYGTGAMGQALKDAIKDVSSDSEYGSVLCDSFSFRDSTVVISDDTYQDFITGRDCLGHGLSRVVYALTPKLVLKVAKNHQGRSDCIAEARRYSTASESIRPHLAKVYACSKTGRWMIVERAESSIHDADENGIDEAQDIADPDMRDAVTRVIEAAQEAGIGDLHMGNVGIFRIKVQGQVVATYKVIDFAWKAYNHNGNW